MKKMDCYTADSKQENSERDEERVEQDDELERASTTRRNVGENHTKKGWHFATGLCGTLVGPSKDTHGTPVPEREGLGWPDTSFTKTTTDKRQHDTDKSQDKCAFISKCRHALGI